MKNFILFIVFAFVFAVPQEMFAQCKTTVASYRDGLGNFICPVGAYTICCDGSLTITGLQATTKIKLNWTNQVCDVYGNGAGDCDDTFTFPTGTVTPGSNYFLEFQSGDFGSDGCGMDYGLVFNIGVELAVFCGLAPINDKKTPKTIASEIVLSPNPASSFVNISNPDARNLIIEIYNIRGQRLLRKAANQTSGEININDLANGMYLIQIQDAETQEYISNEKLIVTK